MTVPAEFAEALGADVVLRVGPRGRALSVSEALVLRAWFDARQRELRGNPSKPERPGESP